MEVSLVKDGTFFLFLRKKYLFLDINLELTFFFIFRFVGLCLRFAEDFETSLDDWKPDMTDNNVMNLCVVSEGTYEVCSRTIAQKQDKSGVILKYIFNYFIYF